MLKTLSSMQENIEIRSKMQKQGTSFISNKNNLFEKVLNRLFSNRVSVGELNKSWDVFEASEIIKERFSTSDSILDMGAYGSEALLTLRALGFKKLTGIDLNPQVVFMPFSDEIDYHVGDFYATKYPNSSFSAITSISAIEHGCDVKKLLNEVKRLLKPGGIFIASTDYWPTKIDTSNIKMFNLDWVIFSKSELEELIEYAKSIQLMPLGECNFTANENPIECAGKKYTFAILAFVKNNDT
jgi:SAM-dependent methyltransferase